VDAYGALRDLRGRRDVIGGRIGVQGWSNGAMTVLATLSDQAPGIDNPNPSKGFRAALAEYPGCGMDAVKGEYRAYAPLLLMIAAEDEEVSPKICESFAKRAKAAGSPLQTVVYPGAHHNYDDPGAKKQSVPANRRATEETYRRAGEFFAKHLNP
jgi:carboxymethylenebutenolidase